MEVEAQRGAPAGGLLHHISALLEEQSTNQQSECYFRGRATGEAQDNQQLPAL